MNAMTTHPDDRWIRRAVLIVFGLILLYFLWNILLAIVVVVAGVLIAARFGGPILRFFSSCGDYVRRNL